MKSVKVNNIAKNFKDKTAIDDLSFEIEQGQIFGLLGSNGAGKTTTINLLTGLLLPDKGEMEVLGFDVIREIQEIRKKISLVPQTISLYQELTVSENLEFFGGLYIDDKEKVKYKASEMMSVFSLNSHKKNKICELSGGFQRRCSFATALISDPQVLFLDEPLTGIDIKTNKLIVDFLKTLESMTIIFATHSLEAAEEICDSVLFLNKGRKILHGQTDKILDDYSKEFGKKAIIKFKNKRYCEEAYKRFDDIFPGEIKILENSIYIKNINNNFHKKIARILEDNNDKISDMEISKSSLKDIYYNIMKEDHENNQSN